MRKMSEGEDVKKCVKGATGTHIVLPGHFLPPCHHVNTHGASALTERVMVITTGLYAQLAHRQWRMSLPKLCMWPRCNDRATPDHQTEARRCFCSRALSAVTTAVILHES